MTSRTSPKAFRLNISNFWENYTFHEKEEYHLLDKKIKSFFSTIIEGFIREPLHFWFFKTHFYPFKKKKRFAKVYRSSDGPSYMKYRLLNLNIKNKSPLIEGNLRKKSLRLLNKVNKSIQRKGSGVIKKSRRREKKGGRKTTYSASVNIVDPGLITRKKIPKKYNLKVFPDYMGSYRGQAKKESAAKGTLGKRKSIGFFKKKNPFSAYNPLSAQFAQTEGCTPGKYPAKEGTALGQITYIRKHILRALYLPSLLKRKKLPFNFQQLAKFHHEYLIKNSTFYKTFLQRGGEWLRQGDRRSLKVNKSSKSSKVLKEGKSQKGNKASKISSPLMGKSKGDKKRKFAQPLSKKERILSKRLEEKKRKMKKKGFILPFGEGPKRSRVSNIFKNREEVGGGNQQKITVMTRASGGTSQIVYPHRLFLTYNSNLRMASDSFAAHPPIILGKCQILKAPSIAYVKISYYLDLDQTYTSEITTLLIYRLLASKSYLERVLHMKIKVNLTNYFLFFWKLSIYKPVLRAPLRKPISRIICKKRQREIRERQAARKNRAKNYNSGEKTLSNNPRNHPIQSPDKRPLNALTSQENNRNKEEGADALARSRAFQLQFNLLRNERSFFTEYDELIKNIINDLGKWKKNRFFNRTINIIIPMFFYEFDSVLVANLISFELSNLRKGHGYYIQFLKKTLKKCFSQKKFRKFRKSYSGLPLLKSIKIKLTGRLTKSRRPSTRTQVIGFKIGSSKSSGPKKSLFAKRRGRRFRKAIKRRVSLPPKVTPANPKPHQVRRQEVKNRLRANAREVLQVQHRVRANGREVEHRVRRRKVKHRELHHLRYLRSLKLIPTKKIRSQRLMQNNPITRADSFQTISYNRFGIINIELVVFYNP